MPRPMLVDSCTSDRLPCFLIMARMARAGTSGASHHVNRRTTLRPDLFPSSGGQASCQRPRLTACAAQFCERAGEAQRSPSGDRQDNLVRGDLRHGQQLVKRPRYSQCY
jgi:hypothetical protein